MWPSNTAHCHLVVIRKKHRLDSVGLGRQVEGRAVGEMVHHCPEEPPQKRLVIFVSLVEVICGVQKNNKQYVGRMLSFC